MNDKAKIDALRAARVYIDQNSVEQGYGFARPLNPHDFFPDHDSCSTEEIAAHKAACEAYDKGEYTPERGCEWVGKMHILRAPWGIGSYTFRDPEAEKIIAAIDAALTADASEQAAPAAPVADTGAVRVRPPKYRLSDTEKAALDEAGRTGALFAEMDGGAIMFINRGEQPGDFDYPTCPTCHGSGHADAAPATPTADTAILERQVAEWRKEVARLQDLISTATPTASADSAADARDAARYRWLRAKRDIPHGERGIPWAVHLDPAARIHTMTLCAEIELDTAIDAAIASIQPTTGEKA